MTPTTLEAAFDRVVQECREIFIQRQQEYGPDNINAIGVMGLAIEMMNKGARGKRVAAWLDFGYGKQPEKPEDPFLDGANYAIMALMKMRGWWGLPLAPAPRHPMATTHITANPLMGEAVKEALRMEKPDASPVQTMDHGA